MMDSSIRFLDATKGPADHFAGVGYEYYSRGGVTFAIADSEDRLRTCVGNRRVWRKWPARDMNNEGMTVYVLDERHRRAMSEDKKNEEALGRRAQNVLEKEPAKVLKPESPEAYDAAQAVKSEIVRIFETQVYINGTMQPVKYLFVAEHLKMREMMFAEDTLHIEVQMKVHRLRRPIADIFKTDLRMGRLKPMEDYLTASANTGVPDEAV
jgi:hypothetical protein